jgi:hypothetical protein
MKYLKGSRNYHLVEDGAKLTKCGHNIEETGQIHVLEDVKDHPDWPNCSICDSGIPDSILKKLRSGRP